VSANLDLVRSIFKVWGDGGDAAFMREHFEPTARLDLSEHIFNPAVYEGYTEIARQRQEVDDVWASFDIQVEQLFEGQNAVVAFTHEHGRGETSGVQVTQNTAFLFRVRDGKISEVRFYRDRECALADLGLTE
jgi:ketosteroid isomerase-like protein